MGPTSKTYSPPPQPPLQPAAADPLRSAVLLIAVVHGFSDADATSGRLEIVTASFRRERRAEMASITPSQARIHIAAAAIRDALHEGLPPPFGRYRPRREDRKTKCASS
jgi:hypothetical protein